MNIGFVLLSLSSVIAGFIVTLLLALSNVRFTKGKLNKIISNFIKGTLLTYGGLVSQLLSEIFQVYGTPLDVIKYLFFLFGFSFYLLASSEIFELSQVVGFASKKVPKKLKKILS